MNAQQLEVVHHRGSPLLVFAAAGTGKTQALTARIADLVLRDGVPPDRILALTFTRKAAEEMRTRAAAQIGGGVEDNARVHLSNVGTFHSLCLRWLRVFADDPDAGCPLSRDFTVLDPQDARGLMQECVPSAPGETNDAQARRKRCEEIMRVVDAWRNQGLHPDDVRRMFEAEEAAAPIYRDTNKKNTQTTRDALHTYEAYRAACTHQDVSDFNDLLLHVTSALERAPRLQALCQARLYAHLLVDEFQDTNPCQMKLVELLCEHAAKVDAFVDATAASDTDDYFFDDSDDGNNDNNNEGTQKSKYGVRRGGRLSEDRLMVVGDDYQAIHGWRGAAVRNITCFADSFPRSRTLHLETNYRSLPRILEAAGSLIMHNAEQHHKRLDAARCGPLISASSSTKASTKNDDALSSCPLIVRPCADAWREANLVVSVIRRRGIRPGDAAVLYRTHAQSQPVEEAFRKAGIPYVIKGTLSFFCRAEIKDCLAFARFLVNPRSNVDMIRILGSGMPGRGIGKTTVDRLVAMARSTAPPLSLWEAAAAFARSEGRNAKRNATRSVARFVETMGAFVAATPSSLPASGVLRNVLEATGYLKQLRDSGASDPGGGRDGSGAAAADAHARLDNVTTFLELAGRLGGEGEGGGGGGVDASTNGDFVDDDASSSTCSGRPPTLREFVDACTMEEEEDEEKEKGKTNGENVKQQKQGKVMLTTLHASKGLEFPAVFMVGACEDLLPYYASRGDSASVAEERRLCYVGFTRARDLLVVTHPRERQLFGNRVSCARSRFLAEAAIVSSSS